MDEENDRWREYFEQLLIGEEMRGIGEGVFIGGQRASIIIGWKEAEKEE